MRYDSKNHYECFPTTSWFLWGYILHNCRWYPYWRLRLPSRAWEYQPHRDDWGWCWLVLFWMRGRGFDLRYEAIT